MTRKGEKEMLTQTSQTILNTMQVRKTRKQKAAFRAWLTDELTGMGYTPKTEKSFAARNVVVGDPERAEVILGAHYDTCAVMPVPNFITPRSLFWYGLYQILLTAGIFLLAIGAEVLTLLLFDPPLPVALGVMYVAVMVCLGLLMAGPANKHTANDNTSGVVTLVEMAAALPPELRERVCLVFFDNEELGMLGSSAFAKAHKRARKETPVINFDCVGDGSSIQFFPSKGAKKDEALMARLAAAFPGEGEKSAEVVTGFGFYPSDNMQFAKGVGVCALKKSPLFGWYMDRIHTNKDTVLEGENIRFLCRGVLRFLQLPQ